MPTESDLEAQVVETWNVHHRSMLLFLEHLTDEAMSATMSTRGGRDISRQLAHMHMVRVKRLESWAKKNAVPLSHFDKKESPPKEVLVNAFQQSGEAMAGYLAQCLEQGKVTNFKRGIVPMVGYYISHEAHHRGHALLTAKLNGMKFPDELRWGIWDWNKL